MLQQSTNYSEYCPYDSVYYFRVINLLMKHDLHLHDTTNFLKEQKKRNIKWMREYNTLFLASWDNTIYFLDVINIYKMLFRLVFFFKNLLYENLKFLFVMNFNTKSLSEFYNFSTFVNIGHFFMFNLKKNGWNIFGNYYRDFQKIYLKSYKKYSLSFAWFHMLLNHFNKNFISSKKMVCFFFNFNLNTKYTKFNVLKNYHFLNVATASIVDFKNYEFSRNFFDYILPAHTQNLRSNFFYFNFFCNYVRYDVFSKYSHQIFYTFINLKKKLYCNKLKLNFIK